MEILVYPENSCLYLNGPYFTNNFPGESIFHEGVAVFGFSQVDNCETEYFFYIWQRYILKNERHYGFVSWWGCRFNLCLGLSADPLNYLYQRVIITYKSIMPGCYVFLFVMLKKYYDAIFFKRKPSLKPIYYPKLFFSFIRIEKK